MSSLVRRWVLIAISSILSLSVVNTVAQQVKPIPGGICATAGDVTLQVTALRDDVLRVREWKGRAEPEDASWAVLPTARTSRVQVVTEQHGFATSQLRVALDDQLRLTLSDLAGNVLQQDAAPAHWDGTQFTVSKKQTPSDHFFGLGDKPGPLDRAGEAFTMWNTDSFGWQESTDPIYKTIPFFLQMSHGRSIGVFLDNTFRTNFDFGRANPAEYTFEAANGSLDYYLIYGPEPKQVMLYRDSLLPGAAILGNE